MLNFAVALCLFLPTSAYAANNYKSYSPDLPTTQDVEARAEQLQACDEDYVVLRDGTKLCGTLAKLPPLGYSFSNVNLGIEDVAVIAISPMHPDKVHYITRDGKSFVGNLPTQKFYFTEKPADNQKGPPKRRELDPKEINYMILKPRGKQVLPLGQKLYGIFFKDGNLLPVSFVQKTVTVGDGLNEKEINTDQIVYLENNEGVHFLQAGKSYPTYASFIRDKFVVVRLPHTGDVLKFPWDKVVYVQKILPSAPISSYSAMLEAFNAPTRTKPGVHEYVQKEKKKRSLLGGLAAALIPTETFADIEQEVFQAPLLTKSAPQIGVVDFIATDYFKQDIVEHSSPVPRYIMSNDYIGQNDRQSTSSSMIHLSLEDVIGISDILVFENSESTDASPEEFDVHLSEDQPSDNSSKEVDPDKEEVSTEIKFSSNKEPTTNSDLIVLTLDSILPKPVDFKNGMLEDPKNSKNLREQLFGDRKEIAENKKNLIADAVQTILTSEEEIKIKHRSEKKVRPAEKSSIPIPSSIEGMWYISYIPPIDPENRRGVHSLSDSSTAGFYMDQKPVTNKDYMFFTLATQYHRPSHWIGGRIPEGLEDEPVTNVTYVDAVTYAMWAGKRLPTKEEWGYALKKKDMNTSICEWTSSSDSTRGINFKAIHYPQSSNYALMHKEDCNTTTGFRLALEAPR